MRPHTERYKAVALLFWQEAFFGSTSDPFNQSETVKVVDPASDEEIRTAELQLGQQLPDSYQWFQKEFGNFQNAVPDIYTVRSLPKTLCNIVCVNRFEQSQVFPKLPAHLIAFSDESGGDSYCFDTSNYTENECPVVFWDHEADEQQSPEVVAPTFLDWLDDVLNERNWFAP